MDVNQLKVTMMTRKTITMAATARIGLFLTYSPYFPTLSIVSLLKFYNSFK